MPPGPQAAHPDPDLGGSELRRLQALLRSFASARDWDRFHTPKNLAMALAGECGELVAELQWLTPDEAASVMQSPAAAGRVRDEVADVAIYLLRLCDVLDIDLVDAVQRKVELNESRYPAETARGNARKYNRLAPEA